jgi:AcrR family transcriptional regulator
MVDKFAPGVEIDTDMTSSLLKQKPSPRATQARGRARRVELLAAARSMLASQSFDQIGMVAIAEEAGIPASSAYHLFSDIGDLWRELARTIATAQAAEDLMLPQAQDWETLVELSLDHHQSAFNADPAARQLLLGPHTPPEIKNAGCKEDFRFGTALWTIVRIQFALPELADSREIFFKALLIADVFFSLSVADHGLVTDAAVAEAKSATVAYLSLYLPTKLARKELA